MEFGTYGYACGRKSFGYVGRRLRGPGPEFWPAAIAKVKKKYPQFVMIAEVYNMGKDMSYKLQHQGFDFTYDKKLYDRIVTVTPPECMNT